MRELASALIQVQSPPFSVSEAPFFVSRPKLTGLNNSLNCHAYTHSQAHSSPPLDEDPLVRAGFRFRRWLDALEFGSGLDYEYHSPASASPPPAPFVMAEEQQKQQQEGSNNKQRVGSMSGSSSSSSKEMPAVAQR